MKESEMINPNSLGDYHRDITMTKIIDRWNMKVIMSCSHSKVMSRTHYKKYKDHATLCLKCSDLSKEKTQMPKPEKVTINMDAEFLEWWNSKLAPHIRENQTIMIVAWWAYQLGKKAKEGDE